MALVGSDSIDRLEVFDRFADVLKALANGRRLEIIEVLSQGEHTVETLARMTLNSVTTTSNHLQLLKRVGLVATRREGTSIHYRVAGPDVVELFVAAKKVALDHSPALAVALESYLSEPEAAVPLLDAVDITDAMTVIDVRPIEEFDAGHLPGALSIPFADLDERIGEIPGDRPVAVYCRGEMCRRAREATVVLRDKGVDARAVPGGVMEWRAAGDWAGDTCT